MLLRLATEPQIFLIVALAFVIAITLHEASHAIVATWLGDDLPGLQGRVSLNPLRHLDPLGTVMIVIASVGWGRPVLVNPYRLRFGPRRGMALIAAAGPASNIILALALTPIARELLSTGPVDTLSLIAVLVIQLNIFLAIFNLLPLPPLDGFSVLVGILPEESATRLDSIRKYGPGILLGLFLVIAFIPGAPGIISGPANWLLEVLLGL